MVVDEGRGGWCLGRVTITKRRTEPQGGGVCLIRTQLIMHEIVKFQLCKVRKVILLLSCGEIAIIETPYTLVAFCHAKDDRIPRGTLVSGVANSNYIEGDKENEIQCRINRRKLEDYIQCIDSQFPLILNCEVAVLGCSSPMHRSAD